jgi:hypothetical protein
MFKPQFDGHICSLGYEVIDWIQTYCCHGPGDLQGEPVTLDPEMQDHIIECYRLDETTGRRVFDEAVLSRAKGRAKSEIAGFIVVAEGVADCVRFDGWGADGQPKGRPVRSPLIKCLATEEGQAGNTFQNAAYIAGSWGPDAHPDIFGGITGLRNYQSATQLYLPGGGEMRACTAGAASKDGGKETHVVADETHLYVLPELKAMYATTARNLSKRKLAEPWLHQTSTAYRPGEQSVFEDTLAKWRKGELSSRVFVNHREAKGKIDLDDEDRTMRQLAEAYGDSAGWQDLDRKYAERNDTRYYKDSSEWVRYCLNRPQSGDDAWIAKDVVERQVRTEVVPPGTAIAIGFDGSIRDDATVLIGCRMTDGFLFPIGIWAKPEGIAGNWWQVPRSDVLAVIREAHGLYDVVRGYYDPHEWRSDIESLSAELGETKVVPWETRRDLQMAAALDRLRTDLMQGGEPDRDGSERGRAWHSGDPVLMEHFGNAYVRRKGGHVLVRKEHEQSDRKIDCVPGAALAYEARADALADGWGRVEDRRMVFFR